MKDVMKDNNILRNGPIVIGQLLDLLMKTKCYMHQLGMEKSYGISFLYKVGNQIFFNMLSVSSWIKLENDQFTGST